MSQQADILKTLKPSKMNRLQRSLMSGRVPAVANDSTVHASNFLSNTIDVLRRFLSDHVEVDDWKVSGFLAVECLRSRSILFHMIFAHAHIFFEILIS
jgi:hypothetical protein